MIAIIPARTGSQGIHDKNIRLFGGKPLIAHTIIKAFASKHIDKVLVSTDSPIISIIADLYGADRIIQPPEISGDNANIFDVYEHIMKYINVKEFIVLLATSPLKTTQDIDNSIELFYEKKADCVVGVTISPHPPSWFYKIDNEGILRKYDGKVTVLKNRQLEIPSYVPAGCMFVMKTELIKKRTYYTDKTYPYVIPQIRAIDIDTELDFMIAEYIYKMVYKMVRE